MLGCHNGTQCRVPPGEAAAGPGSGARGSGGHDSQPLRVQIPSPYGVGQVEGETAASETPACEHLPSRRAPAHSCFWAENPDPRAVGPWAAEIWDADLHTHYIMNQGQKKRKEKNSAHVPNLCGKYVFNCFYRLRTKDVERGIRSRSKLPQWLWKQSSLILLRLKCPRITLLKKYVLTMRILKSLIYMWSLSRYVWGLIFLLWLAVSEFLTREWKWSQASEWTRAHISQVIWRSVGCECQWWQQEMSDPEKNRK